MRTLTVSACRRPLYTHLVLSALAQCRNVWDYKVLIHLDATGPMLDELVRVCRPFLKHHDWAIQTLESAPRGCNASIVWCVDWGFAHGSNFHVHLEDDTLPHRDFLTFMEFAGASFWENKDVFSACGYSRIDGEPAASYSRKWFTPWGWGTWSDRWNEVRPLLDVSATLSWDCQMHTLRGDRSEIVPALGLVQNIGLHDGSYNTADIWAREQFAPAWAGNWGRLPLHTGWPYKGETTQ